MRTIRELIEALERHAAQLGDNAPVDFVTSYHDSDEGRVAIDDTITRVEVIPAVESRNWPKPASIRIIGCDYDTWHS